jgi:hypothetical protein
VTIAGGYIRTYVLIFCRGFKRFGGFVFPGYVKEEAMRLLRLAVEIQRWDLAAHTIVLASARVLKNGERPDGGKAKAKKRRPKG